MLLPSRMPNTRESRCSGAERCRSVWPDTVAMLAPTPDRPKSTGAVAAAGAAPTATTEPPKTSVPPPSGGTRRRRPTSETASAAPTSPPTPAAALRKPAQPDAWCSSVIAAAT